MQRILGIISLGILLFSTVFVLKVFAATASPTPIKEQAVVLSPSETVNGNYFNAGNSVTVAGKVNGDVYVAGGNVIVDGTVDGDVFAAGGSVVIRGTVSQNVRAVGGSIDVSGTVGRNVTAVGGTITVSDAAKIRGSVVTAGGNVMVMAAVPKGIDAASGQLTIGNHVGGNVQAAVGQLILTPRASVSGNLTYWSDQDASIQNGARITGTVQKYNSPVPHQEGTAENTVRAAAIASKIIGFLTAVAVGLLLVFFLPNFMENAAATYMKRPWAALGWGFLFTLLLPFAFVILLVIIVGIPLAFILLGLYMLAFYLGKFIVIFAFGTWIAVTMKAKMHAAWAFVLGLLLYEIIQFIPIFGGLMSLVVFFMGIGTLFMEKRRLYKTLRKEKYL